MKKCIDKGNLWIKQHPSALLGIIVGIVGIYIQWSIIALCFSPVEVISMESAMGVLGTSAEVVAGLYGLILTGYIFFLDNLQEKADKDELLEDVITLLKKRYHNMVLLMSINSLIVIFLALGLNLYNPASGVLPEVLYRLMVYETIFFVFFDVVLIVYFVIIMVDPDKIPRISLQYKNKLSQSDKELGSLQEFLHEYEKIEELLKGISEKYALSQIGTNPWKQIKHLKGKQLVQWHRLLNVKSNEDRLLKNLIRVGQYYSYMVFSQEMIVSKEMCDLAKSVSLELKQILKEREIENQE